MSKIPIWMDLIAGLLLAYDLLPKFGKLSRFHDRIREYLKNIDTKNFANIKNMVFSGAVSIFIFLMLLLWAFYKNSSQMNYNIWPEIVTFALGSIIAWGLITLIAIILKKAGTLIILAIGTIISMLAVISLLRFSSLVGAVIAFMYICILYPFAMIIANYVQKVLLADEKKPFYIFAIIGMAIFVISKIFELTV